MRDYINTPTKKL